MLTDAEFDHDVRERIALIEWAIARAKWNDCVLNHARVRDFEHMVFELTRNLYRFAVNQHRWLRRGERTERWGVLFEQREGR